MENGVTLVEHLVVESLPVDLHPAALSPLHMLPDAPKFQSGLDRWTLFAIVSRVPCTSRGLGCAGRVRRGWDVSGCLTTVDGRPLAQMLAWLTTDEPRHVSSHA
jgi:hypothetical protein